jgi:hypothetical protein
VIAAGSQHHFFAAAAGDWIGVVLNRIEQTISFTKKGFELGVAFEGVSEDRLFPSVGFRTPDEEVRAGDVARGSTVLSAPLAPPSLVHIACVQPVPLQAVLRASGGCC